MKFIELVNTLEKLSESCNSGNFFDKSLSQNLINGIDNFKDSDISANRNSFHEYLKLTSKPEFLNHLDYSLRLVWSEQVFRLIQKTEFTLYDLFRQRTEELKHHPYFIYKKNDRFVKLSYLDTLNITTEIAAGLLQLFPGTAPRVAIYSENSPETALTDLACLFNSIFVSPLSTAYSEDILLHIFKVININTVVTDSDERLEKLRSIKFKYLPNLKIIVTNPEIYNSNDEIINFDQLRYISKNQIDDIINGHTQFNLNEVSTAMFTSGTTGTPKGILFSNYNLTSKRFARGAAVPYLGNKELMISYLPLYHTFGRYLEMMGSFYWRGTYVFTGNNSTETLLSLFPKFNPTIFISVPIRWVQLFDRINELIEDVTDSEEQNKIIKSVTGNNLKWGLSAAGYLEPKIFQFFQNIGVDLCSGFGMTEATGGITMTPPGRYKAGSIGVPLPGVSLKLDNERVMQISGHYIAKYLDEENPAKVIEYPNEKENWLSTGDIFQIDEDGYYEIIDRVKDIYKNNRGQTVSPKKIENMFEGVPGIKRAFLVGDGLPYNTLLIVPDLQENVIMNKPSEVRFDYFRQIIIKANSENPNFERIINFSLLDRDFSLELGELTPKLSYNRKKILQNFSDVITKLYEKNYLEFKKDNFIIRINRWIIRDLGIIESDIILRDNYLVNKVTGNVLRIEKSKSNNSYIIGNLEYEIKSSLIDLSYLTSQPNLWVANPELITFLPVKDGWDKSMGNFSNKIHLPDESQIITHLSGMKAVRLKDQFLKELNFLLSYTLYSSSEDSMEYLEQIEEHLTNSEHRYKLLIRRSLQILANHRDENIRCEAYRILLLDEPSPDYSNSFPTFLESGQIFLNETSINKISKGNFEIRRLESLRKRMYFYRQLKQLPEHSNLVKQFDSIFRLLFNFVNLNNEYYSSARYEFISWMLYDKNFKISDLATKYFVELHQEYERNLEIETPKYSTEQWEKQLVFDDDINDSEIKTLKNVIINRAFFKQSVLLAYEEKQFDPADVKDNGIWISKLNSFDKVYQYRISITTKTFKHFELQVYLSELEDDSLMLNSILWHVAISGNPFSYKILPQLGAYRPELKAWSFEYIPELTLWDKIRDLSDTRITGFDYNVSDTLRKLFVSSITAVIKAWKYSNYKIIPGMINPTNIIIPENDFSEGAVVNSVFGFKFFNEPNDIISPVLRNFYDRSISHYPWIEKYLKTEWILDSIIEALGTEDGIRFINEILKNEEMQIHFAHKNFIDTAINYLNEFPKKYFAPASLHNAVSKYFEWEKINRDASSNAKLHIIDELIKIYNLEKLGDIARIYIFRQTYFRNHDLQILAIFDNIINKLNNDDAADITKLAEITEIQNLCQYENDKIVLKKLLFPSFKDVKDIRLSRQKITGRNLLIIETFIKDKHQETYKIREPLNLSEIGELYRLLFKEKYPKNISDNDEYYVLLNNLDRVVGGICYKINDEKVVVIDGIVINTVIKNRGLGLELLKDFVIRMKNKNFDYIETHFMMQNFFLKADFKHDINIGALVKHLK